MRNTVRLTVAAVVVASLLMSGCGKKKEGASVASGAAASAALPEVHLAVAQTGAEVGRWTMDYDAARKTADEKKLPILLMFTGSDWCPYCRTMVKDVLDTQEWQDWVSDKMLQVYIDFPRNEALVPEAYRQRNQELQSNYNVEGFPAFIVLDSDGRPLSRISLRSTNTFITFRRDVRAALRVRREYIERTVSRLPAAEQPTIMANYEKLQADKQLLTDKTKEFEVTLARMREDLEKLGATVENGLLSAYIATLPEEVQTRYHEADSKLSATVDELNNWLESKPAQTPENTQKYNALMQAIQEQRDIIADILDAE